MKERDNNPLSVRHSIYILLGLVITCGAVAYSTPFIVPFLR